MNDYKELIADLRYLSDEFRYPIVNELHAGSLMADAANAIEQFVKTNKALRQSRNSYQHKIKKYRRDYERIKKERNAAVKELNEKCQNCGYKYHSERISELHDCNDCGKKSKCEYEPRPGEYCRINCPHWEEDNNE